jgi:hypothetical protein
MHYIRMYDSTSFNAWDRKTAKEIASKEIFERSFFENDDPQRDPTPSLYQVRSREDEIRTVTAYTLVHTNKKPYILWAIRIYEWDLETLGFQIEDPPGTTGVVDVDFRHCQLRQPCKQQLVDLISRIMDDAIQGNERYRWVGTAHQLPHLNNFLNLSNAEVIEEAKRRCRFKLGQAPCPPKDQSRIRKELQATCPCIPHNRICIAAFLNFRERCLRMQAGTSEGDWDQANRDLWACYVNAKW